MPHFENCGGLQALRQQRRLGAVGPADPDVGALGLEGLADAERPDEVLHALSFL